MALFRRRARWAKAARHVQIFKLYAGWLLSAGATPSQLRRIVADLKRRRIALALEVGALSPDTCGAGVEGFADPSDVPRLARIVKAAGGTVRYVAFDEPFAFGSLYDGENACRWSPERVAQELADYVRRLHGYFPKAVAGDIEPLWAGVDPRLFVDWMDTYARVTGRRLPFFHLDLDFTRPDWPQDAHSLEDAARARGIPFGVIYYGGYGRASDREWTGAAEERFVDFEAKEGGRPDQVVFQSWEDRPEHVLPETKTGTFTWLIDRYFRPRTTLSLGIGDGVAFGRLTGAHGESMYARRVRLTATPLDGPGARGQYTLTGKVPAGAGSAVVGFRVNTECGCSGAADFTLFEARYQESGGLNRVPNPQFDQGLDGWGYWGDGLAQLEPVGIGGQALHVTAATGQVAAINSAVFSVTPGAAFRLTFGARVAPASTGSGYLDVVFLGPSTEISRRTLNLAAAPIAVGTPATNRLGRYSAPLGLLPSGSLFLEAWFQGGTRLFPSYVARRISG